MKSTGKIRNCSKLKSNECRRKIAPEFGISVGKVNAKTNNDKEIIAVLVENNPSSQIVPN